MGVVPEGGFWMGGNREEHHDCLPLFGLRPRHAVTLSAFYIDKLEVTVVQYRACVNAKRCTVPDMESSYGLSPTMPRHLNWGIKGRDKMPVNGVSWHQAKAYCAFVGKRLPTEAEWEKAARGVDKRTYTWGEDQPERQACWNRNDKSPGTCEVGSRPQDESPFGVRDMNGNVSEWLSDWYVKDYYARSPERDPQGPDNGERRCVRGGSYSEDARMAMPLFIRHGNRPDADPSFAGIRCAKSVGK